MDPKERPKSRCTSGNITVSVLSVFLTLLGAALLTLGIINKDHCPSQAELPIWMISSGASLILICSFILLYELCVCSPCCPDDPHRSCLGTTCLALSCACILGIFVVVASLLWLGLWIAGTYYVVLAYKDMRLEVVEVEHQKVDCDLASVILSFVSIIIMWFLLLVLLIWGGVQICQLGKKSQRYSEVNTKDNQ